MFGPEMVQIQCLRAGRLSLNVPGGIGGQEQRWLGRDRMCRLGEK